MARMREGPHHVALNTHSSPTAAFVRNANWQNPGDACAAEIARAVGRCAWAPSTPTRPPPS
jgi:indolepyruvate ferredoxin oxidoreductase